MLTTFYTTREYTSKFGQLLKEGKVDTVTAAGVVMFANWAAQAGITLSELVEEVIVRAKTDFSSSRQDVWTHATYELAAALKTLMEEENFDVLPEHEWDVEAKGTC